MLVGADINSKSAVVVVTDDSGSIVEGLPDRLEPANDADQSAKHVEYTERVVQHLRAINASAVVLTDVDLSRGRPSSIRAQAYLEAAFMFAAQRLDADFHVVHQRSIAKQIGLAGNASKDAIRRTVSEITGDNRLLPDPARRARAVAAVWAALGIRPGA